MPSALSELAQVNPQVNVPVGAGALTPVSFVPMADVSESGLWTGRQVRALREVSNGFTAFANGDILIAKITPCFENGKGAQVVGLTNGIGFGSTEFHVLRARDGVSPRFVYHVAQSARLRMTGEAYMSGSAGQKRVPREFFDAFSVPDLPLQEQQKVSEVLDTLDTTIRQTEAIIEKLKQVKQGLLHDLLTRGIDANGELRPPQSQAPHLYKDSPLGWIPRAWSSRPLGEVIGHLMDYRGRTPKKLGMDWGGGDILALSANNVQMGGIDTSREAYFGSDRLYARWMTNGDPARGDVLMTLEAPLGNVAQVPDDRRYILSQRVILIRFSGDAVSNDFAFWQLICDPFQRAMIKFSTGTTATGIQRAKLVLILFAVPPLEEQQAIDERLRTIEARLAAERSTAHKLRLQKSGLMDDLLTGRVRVTPLVA